MTAAAVILDAGWLWTTLLVAVTHAPLIFLARALVIRAIYGRTPA